MTAQSAEPAPEDVAAAAAAIAETSAIDAAEVAEPDAAPAIPDFRIGYVPGVTLSKWGGKWKERHGRLLTTFTMLSEAEQIEALHGNLVDVSFVRFPIAGDDVHAVPLYSEVPMVVLPKDHPLNSFDELSLEDLAGEHLIQDPAEVSGWDQIGTEMLSGTRRDVPAPERAEDAIELVAAGIGFVIVPQSIARLYARKDVAHRRLRDYPETRIAIAWRDNPEEDAELAALIEDFVGIVRGRTANSSRGKAEAIAQEKADIEAKRKAEKHERYLAQKRQQAKQGGGIRTGKRAAPRGKGRPAQGKGGRQRP